MIAHIKKIKFRNILHSISDIKQTWPEVRSQHSTCVLTKLTSVDWFKVASWSWYRYTILNEKVPVPCLFQSVILKILFRYLVPRSPSPEPKVQLRGVKSDIDLSECKWSGFSLQKKLSGARAIALNFRVTKQSCIQCSCSNAYSIQNTPWMHIKIIVKMWCIEHVNIKSMCFFRV